MDAGLAGGIAGGIVGVLGGVVGTAFSIANTTRPRERALAIRLSAFFWVWMTGSIAFAFLLPSGWRPMALMLNMPLLLSIPRMNGWLAMARQIDQLDEV